MHSPWLTPGSFFISYATGQVVGQKPIVVNADEGANVYVHTNSNSNGNGHAALQREFNRRQR